MATVMEQEREERIASNKRKLQVRGPRGTPTPRLLGPKKPRRPAACGGGGLGRGATTRVGTPPPRATPAHRPRQELGIEESVEALVATRPAPRPRPERRAPAGDAAALEPTRRSGRPRNEINWAERLAEADRAGREYHPREPMDYAARVAALQLDAGAAERMRAEIEARRAKVGARGEGKKAAGPKDSGKGVRVQVGGGAGARGESMRARAGGPLAAPPAGRMAAAGGRARPRV